MPILSWPSKSVPSTQPGDLLLNSIIYPDGQDYTPEGSESIPEDVLIWGDNQKIMSSMMADFEGKIDLIYADPPFFTNRKYRTRVGRGEDSRKPDKWELAEGYTDSWPNLEAYLDMLHPRLQLMYNLLSPNGTLYLHLDWHANSYARILLDEIFGTDRLLNEIIWVYHGPSPIRSAFNRKHDTILVYTKSDQYIFNVDQVRQPYNPSTIKTFSSSPKAGFGKVPDLERGKVPEDWWYFPVVARLHNERTGYPTQKPEALIERIILASSNSGDLVADFFCGSGTFPAVATRLGRRYIASDNMWRAIHTTRRRLVTQRSNSFLIKHEPSSPYPVSEKPLNYGYFKLTQNQNMVEIVQDEDDDLDYWEVDPCWDGEIFRSVTQAVRPRKKGTIPHRLPVEFSKPGSPICIRTVTSNGELGQAVLQVS